MTARTQPLRFTSLVSTMADPFCAALADYLADRLHRAVEFVMDGENGSRETLLDTQAVDLAWLCGLLYLHKTAAGQRLTPAVAPCMVDEVPHDQPVYYAEMIVNTASTCQTFADLRGSRWAYNERASFSGYQVVRAYLATQQEWQPYFGQTIHSGAHLHSMTLVRDGGADCAAIDSTILQMARTQQPALLDGLRTVARLGPYPMPLWVFTEPCAHEYRQPLSDALTMMHTTTVGRDLLTPWQIGRFHPVTADEYTPLRVADALANQLCW